MKSIHSVASAGRHCARAARPLIFVPTMGALHAGHLSLLRKARKLAGPKGTVVVSIFVNPTQFGPKEDLSRYPRPLAADRRLCRENGVDVLFLPAADEIYPEGFSTYVEEGRLSQGMCGRSRPGHFRGVCTVVLKLLNIVAPDAAVFGEKDYQQLAIIRRMVRDLNLAVKIIGAPTVREGDGLALSSRNVYLSAEERAQAGVLRQALLGASDARFTTAAALRKRVVEAISQAPLARIDYVEVLDADSLESVSKHTRTLLIACAVYFGKTRLIDNIRRSVREGEAATQP